MTNIMARLFVDVHLSKAKPTVFRDSNCFLIASTDSEYSFRHTVLRVVGDGNQLAS